MQNEVGIIELFFSFFVYAKNSWDCMHYTLPQLTEPLCEFLETFEGPLDDLFDALERIIRRVIETHRMIFVLRGKDGCKDDLVHSSLLASARLAFRSGFPNSILVARILGEIYSCDKDLRKLLMGAYHEPQKCHGFLLYKSREEGLQAMEYYLYHTNVARKVFFYYGVPRRLADLSLQVPNFYHPAVYSISTNRYDTYKVLVEYGADLCDPSEPKFNHSVQQKMDFGLGLVTRDKQEFRRLFYLAHPELEVKMPSLMELSRKVIRKQLWEAFQLPWGILELPLPTPLKRFVEIEPWY